MCQSQLHAQPAGCPSQLKAWQSRLLACQACIPVAARQRGRHAIAPSLAPGWRRWSAAACWPERRPEARTPASAEGRCWLRAAPEVAADHPRSSLACAAGCSGPVLPPLPAVPLQHLPPAQAQFAALQMMRAQMCCPATAAGSAAPYAQHMVRKG